MYLLIVLFLLIIMTQTFLLWIYQRQIKDICRQLSFLGKHNSNMIISSEIKWGGIQDLITALNALLLKQKKEQKDYLSKEKKLAETYTSLSHDIRTPLTSLDGYVQLLEQCEDAAEQKHYLKVIHERIDSLKDMLEELFTYTKLRNESYRLELSECNLSRILKAAIFSYYDDWKNHNIEPEIEIADTPLLIQGNWQALSRMIQNLLKNAVDHGQRSIGISLRQNGSSAVLQVSNQVENGTEIDVSRVFERFYKQDRARSQASTGLGLSIAKEFVCRMNGEITASVEANIFCITVVFPLQ